MIQLECTAKKQCVSASGDCQYACQNAGKADRKDRQKAFDDHILCLQFGKKQYVRLFQGTKRTVLYYPPYQETIHDEVRWMIEEGLIEG